jgi:5-methylcytosine-specific restriction enzyme A
MAVPLHRDGRRSSHSRGYGVRWRKARLRFLAEHRLCVMCNARGIVSAAVIVDHIKPHKGDAVLFWDENNWQGLCLTDANSVKQAQERSGHLRGADANGVPLDSNHPWHVHEG